MTPGFCLLVALVAGGLVGLLVLVLTLVLGVVIAILRIALSIVLVSVQLIHVITSEWYFCGLPQG